MRGVKSKVNDISREIWDAGDINRGGGSICVYALNAVGTWTLLKSTKLMS